MTDVLQKRARRRKLITRGLIAAGLLLLALFIVGRCTNREPPPNYRTAEVTRGNIESAIVALGTVEPKNYVDVGAQVSGILQAIHYEVGDEVQQGDLLAEIDPELAQSRVDSTQAQLLQLEASRRQQVAQLALARADAERARALRAADAISQAEAEATQAQYEVAQAQLQQTDAQIAGAQSSLEGDLTSLNYTRIYAPMTGTVISHSAVVGQTLNAAQTAPIIMRVADLSVMTVSADVSEADVPRLKAGMPAYFTTLGNPDRRWTATVRQVLPEPEVVNDVVLYKALLDVQNDDRALLPQMSAQVSFVLGQAQNAIKIPAAALQVPPSMLIAAGAQPGGPGPMGEGGGSPEEIRQRFQQGPAATERRPWEANDSERALQAAQPNYVTDFGAAPRPYTVLVMANGRPEPRQIEVGLVSRTEAEVLSGLEPGEVVVLGEAAQAGQPANTGGPGGPSGPPGGAVIIRN